MAATPSRRGIRRSISTTSGESSPTWATACSPSAAVPTTRRSGSLASMPTSPDRTTGWSSATRTPIVGGSPSDSDSDSVVVLASVDLMSVVAPSVVPSVVVSSVGTVPLSAGVPAPPRSLSAGDPGDDLGAGARRGGDDQLATGLLDPATQTDQAAAGLRARREAHPVVHDLQRHL